MPKISKSWSNDAYDCFVETLHTDYAYINLSRGKQIATRKDFTLEFYKENKTFTIVENKTSKIAGVLYVYIFNFDEVLDFSSRGILIDNPVIFKEYRGNGLSQWAYSRIQKFYNLPIVASSSHTKDVLYSVWLNLSKTESVYAKNKVTKKIISNWSSDDINITHGKDGKNWYLIYKGDYTYGRKARSRKR